MFNQHYKSTWKKWCDLQVELIWYTRFFGRTIWEQIAETMELTGLTLKVSMLLVLLSASRISEITNMRVYYWTNQPSIYTFAVPHLPKTCQKGQKPHSGLKFYNFPGDGKLCKTIDSYLDLLMLSRKYSSFWSGRFLQVKFAIFY